jgi:hypothetical protein
MRVKVLTNPWDMALPAAWSTDIAKTLTGVLARHGRQVLVEKTLLPIKFAIVTFAFCGGKHQEMLRHCLRADDVLLQLLAVTWAKRASTPIR